MRRVQLDLHSGDPGARCLGGCERLWAAFYDPVSRWSGGPEIAALRLRGRAWAWFPAG
jgi:hypothetical protein